MTCLDSFKNVGMRDLFGETRLGHLRLTRLNRWLLGGLVFLLALVPGAYYSAHKVTNPFLYHTLAQAEASRVAGHLGASLGGVGAPDIAPANAILLIELSAFTGLPISTVQFLPIGTMLVALAVFAFMLRWSRLVPVAVLALVYFAFDPSLGMGIYNVFAYSWTMPLYLVFLSTYFVWLEQGSPRSILALILLFVGANFIHYAAPVWMIVSAAVATVFVLVRARAGAASGMRAEQVVGLGALLTTFYLSFNKVLYDVVLPSENQDFLGETYRIFIDRVLAIAGVYQAPQASTYAYAAPGNPLLNRLLLIQYGLLIAIVVTAALWTLVAMVRAKRLRFASRGVGGSLLLLTILAATALIDIVSYSFQGIVSMKYILLAVPLLGVLAWARMPGVSRRRVVAVVLAGSLTAVGVAKFVTYTRSDLPQFEEGNDPRLTRPGIAYILEHGTESPRVLSDLHTQGRALLQGASGQRHVLPAYYDVHVYGAVVGSELAPSGALEPVDYVLVDTATERSPVISIFWRSFEPLSGHLDEVEENPRLDLLYADGNSHVLRPVA